MKKKILGPLVILIIIIIFNIDSNLKNRIGYLNYDFYQNIFEKNFSTNKVIIVDIDEESIKKLGQFPWRRDIHSIILDKLQSANVALVAFDIFFSETDKQNPKKILTEFNIVADIKSIIDTDNLFLESIKNSNVILPLVGSTKDTKKNQFSIKSNIITKGEDPLNYLYSYQGFIASLNQFNEAAKGLGSISIIDSEDGILRAVPLFLNINQQLTPALSMEAIRLLNSEENYVIETDLSGIQTIKTRSTNFKTNENGLKFIKFKKLNKESYVSASDIYDG